MARITQEMKDVAAKARPVICATSSREGKPNGVPIGFAKIISDDEIMLADNFMHKTRQNIEENPVVAVSCWSPEMHGGYQFKGKARIETIGKLFDEAVQWVKTVSADWEKPRVKPTPKAVILVKVEEIYYIGGGRDSSQNLF